MSPKKRNTENRGLPARWRHRMGAYQYRVPPGLEHLWDGRKEFRLGKTYSEALAVYAARVGLLENVSTMDELCDRYAIEVIPGKAPATQHSNFISMKRIRATFSGNKVAVVSSPDCFAYADRVTKKHGKAAANRDVEVLSHMFSQAIRWGVISNDKHPIRGLRMKNSMPGRDRYVHDWELEEFRKVCGEFLDAFIDLSGVTGYRKGDLLSIKRSDILPEGLSRSDNKTGKKKLLPMTPELEAAINKVKAIKQPVSSIYLFCTRKGEPYIKADRTTSGFDSIWQRRIKKAVAETDLVERFTVHDLRGKVGSDMETDERAQELLDHSSVTMTRKSYRRKGKVVTPAKGFKRC